MSKAPVDESPFVITRTYAAPRERVWNAWTRPEELRKWWGPAGFKVHHCEVDLRPGGRFLYGMTAPDGTPMWGRFIYREIEKPSKLVFVISFSDPQGGVTRHPWAPGWPLHMMAVVTFEARRGGTEVRIQTAPHEAPPEDARTFYAGRDSMKQGWTGTLDKLVPHLGADT